MTASPPPAPPPVPPAPPALDPSPYQPPPPPYGPPARGQLRRSRSDKVIGGVAGGLARYSGIDALLWRVGFVALAFAGGTGVLVYLLLWLLMPADPAQPGWSAEPERDDEAAGPRSPVPGLTVAALLIVVGTLALIARFTPWEPDPEAFVGSALLVVGLGLVAAAFVGGRSAKGGLITLGIVLSLALLVASAEPWRDADGGVGDRTYRPATAADVRPVYDLGVGEVTLDLSRIDVGELAAPVTTRLDAGLGRVWVLVPEDADVRVDVDSGMGTVRLFEDQVSDDGLYSGEGSGSWVDDGEPEIVLTVNMGMGDVEVTRG